MIRAVVDTNLIVSGTAVSAGVPFELLEAWRQGKYILVTSPQILLEIRDVLNRQSLQSYFGLTKQDTDDVLATLSAQAFVSAGELTVDEVKNDPDDNMFLACAIEGTATYVITGDKHHLLPLKEYQGVKIVTARYFLEKCLK